MLGGRVERFGRTSPQGVLDRHVGSARTFGCFARKSRRNSPGVRSQSAITASSILMALPCFLGGGDQSLLPGDHLLFLINQQPLAGNLMRNRPDRWRRHELRLVQRHGDSGGVSCDSEILGTQVVADGVLNRASTLTKPDPFSLTETDPGDAQESVICAISAVTERGLAEPRRRGGALR